MQVHHNNGTSNTYNITNTTPPFGTVTAPIVSTDKKIYLGGLGVNDNQINDVYLRIVNSDGTFNVRISSVGKCTVKGINDIEVELTNIRSWKLPLTITGVTYKTSSEVNPENIQLKSFPFLPLIEVWGNSQAKWKSDCLMSYLGWRGMPTIKNVQSPATVLKQGVPLLGYYEIFKRYYANKQEENAYVIVPLS